MASSCPVGLLPANFVVTNELVAKVALVVGLDDVDGRPESLSGGRARSQSIGMAGGMGLVDAIPSVASLIESLRILLVDICVLLVAEEDDDALKALVKVRLAFLFLG